MGKMREGRRGLQEEEKKGEKKVTDR